MNAPWRVMMRRRICGGRACLAVLVGGQLAVLSSSRATSATVLDYTELLVPHLQLIPHKASAAQWQLLPGVGPVLAKRLVGALRGDVEVSIQSIDEVWGVGPSRLRAWRNLLRVSGCP